MLRINTVLYPSQMHVSECRGWLQRQHLTLYSRHLRINETTTKRSRLYDVTLAVAVLSDCASVAAASCIDCA